GGPAYVIRGCRRQPTVPGGCRVAVPHSWPRAKDDSRLLLAHGDRFVQQLLDRHAASGRNGPVGCHSDQHGHCPGPRIGYLAERIGWQSAGEQAVSQTLVTTAMPAMWPRDLDFLDFGGGRTRIGPDNPDRLRQRLRLRPTLQLVSLESAACACQREAPALIRRVRDE